MGNKTLRPSEDDPLRGFDDDQLQYLAQKFELVSTDGLLDTNKLAEAFQCSSNQASNILRYVDFEGEGQVDFYEFKCAAASLHQNDEQAEQMIFGLYSDSKEMNRQQFEQFFQTVFKYLKFVTLGNAQYSQELGRKKFQKYDVNANGSINLEEFRRILKEDYECRLWMDTLGFCKEVEGVRQKDKRDEEQDIGEEDGDGDEAGSTPSWIKTIDYMQPKDYHPPKDLNTVPSTNLLINYIYGYRSYDTRNNLRYSPKGEAVYHTAGAGIVLNQNKNTMRVTTVHNDDITCLDSFRNLVATAEMGNKPLIAIWDSETMETVMTFNKPLQKSISNIAFSPSGRLIAATSMSDNHEIAIYDIGKKCLLATGNGPRSPIFALKFTQNEEYVVCGCAKQVVFASISGKNIKLNKGIFGKIPVLPTTSLARIGEDGMASGMGNGNILIWRGTSCSKPLKQHNAAVTALTETLNGGLLSGDADGNIVLWTKSLVAEKKYSLDKLLAPKVSNMHKIIALAERQGSFLVGTRGGEIVQVISATSPPKATIIMEGHYDKQLWGLVMSPNKNEFFTAGQDKLLIKWDIQKRKMIEKRVLEFQVQSIDLSLKINILAVGFRNGVVTCLDSNTLKSNGKIANHKNPDKEVLSLLKFSPSGDQLAVSYCPPVSKIYMYSTANWKKTAECRGSPSRIIHIDYSSPADFILTNNTSYEILLFNTKNGALNGNASYFKNQNWATLTSKFSWQTRGIWPHLYADATNINTVDRSHDQKLMAIGDDFSKVRLFRYPACIQKQASTQYKGHSSHVTGVRWSFDDRYLISIGGLEKSIIQWNIDQAQDIVYDYEQEKEEQKQQIEDGQYDIEPQPEEQAKESKPKDQDEIDESEGEGQQAGACKPFQGQVKSPSDFVFNKQKYDVLPKEQLKLAYAWGIRNQYINDEVRNQLRYSAKYSSCIFITAALGVEMDIKSLNQTFFNGQTNDLICMAVTKDRKYVATGQMAEINMEKRSKAKVEVQIWSADDKKTINTLKMCHERAVVVVEFSPNGQLLLTIGQDDKNLIKIYNWKTITQQWPEQPTSRAKATGACWKSNTEYATVGLDHVKFWSAGKGVMGKLAKWDPMFSIASVDNKYVSGSGSGALYVWSGGMGSRVEAHKKGKVHCLLVDNSKNVYSGGQDGSIFYWKIQGNSLVKHSQIVNMSKYQSFCPGVLSLDLSKNEDKLLVCTKGSQIYEVTIKKPNEQNCLMKSHFQGELWACTFSPDGKNFVSAGDDKTLRIYDVKSRKMAASYKLDNMIRSVDWCQNKPLIVCGDYKGKIFLFDEKLQLKGEGKTRFSRMKPRQSTYWIEDIKFSPDGNKVAFGAHGGRSHIEIFNVQADKFGKGYHLNVGFSSALLHLDWSKDGSNIVSVSQAYELKFARVDEDASDKADVAATSMRNTEWATWTCKFGFPVQGIWQDVDYSNINTVCASPSRQLLATGGDDQVIRLFKYPVVVPKQKNKGYVGHASHVTRVRFSNDEQYLLSAGGNDRTILLWDVLGLQKKEKNLESEEQPQKIQSLQDFGDPETEVDQMQIDIPIDHKQIAEQEKQQLKKNNEDELEEDEGEGDEFMAVKPWLGAIKQPTKPYYKSTGKDLKLQLQLEYAYGYRSKDCRNNLCYLSPDKISYHTAAIGVTMRLEDSPKTQQFFIKHIDDILSMTWSRDKQFMYTGQLGPNPSIHEWNQDCQHTRTYKGLKKGVVALDCNEKYLVGAAMDDDHNVIVFDRASGKAVAKEKGGKQFIIALKFLSESTFVSVGIKHFRLWQLKGAAIKPSKGQFGKNCDILCCVDTSNNKAYVGAGDGTLQIWNGTSIAKSFSLNNKKPLDAIRCLSNVILTGGKDGTINILKLDSCEVLSTINCNQVLKNSQCPSIRALDAIDNKLLIGTLGCQIYQLTGSSNVDQAVESTFQNPERLMSGHYSPNAKWTNEVWGLAIPTENNQQFVTCSDDATIRVWDLQKKEEIASQRLDFDQKLKKLRRDEKTGDYRDEAKGRCIAISPDGHILVGCKDGTVRIFDENLKPLSCSKIAKKEISVIKFDRQNTIVAIGSHDTYIYFCTWKAPELKVKYKSKKHSSYITHIDFSCDGNYIHSTCGAYELLFWNTATGQQCTSGATLLRDEHWLTWTTTLGWPVQGIWSKFMDGTDINAVDRSRNAYENDKRYVATSNDRGELRVFEYPCVEKESKSVVGKGHSSHVTNVNFSHEDEYIITTGGQDQTVMQWKVIHL